MNHCFLSLWTLLLVVSTTPLRGLTTDDLLALALQSPLPTATNLEVAIAAAENTFVLAGDGGIILTTQDGGDHWSSVSAGTSNWTTGAFGNGIAVMLGPSTWATSSDLVTWESARFGSFFLPNAVAFGNERFVAVGTNGRVRISTDGMIWEAHDLPDPWSLSTIVFADDRFVAASGSDILTSIDGETWTPLSTISSTLFATTLSHAHDLYTIGARHGILLTSPDAETWTTRETGVTYPIETVTWNDGLYVIKGSGGNLLITDDWITFQSGSTGVSGQSAIAQDGEGHFIACGLAGAITRSLDGATWTDATRRLGADFESVAHGNGVFVTVDTRDQSIYHSADGSQWTLAMTLEERHLSSVTFYQGAFRILGNSGLWSSTNGVAWEASPLPIDLPTVDTLQVTNDHLIAIASYEGILLVTDDTESWSTHLLNTSGSIDHLTHADGLYVVVGSEGFLHTSPDLQTWTARSLNDPNANLVRVLHDGTHFFAFDRLRKAPFVSGDGMVWTQPDDMPSISGAQAQVDPILGIYGVTGGHLWWHAPGADPVSDWESTHFPHRLTISDVVHGPDNLVAVGRSGLVMRAALGQDGFAAWAGAYFGSSHDDVFFADPDYDGQSTAEEYAAGTDPTVGNHPLRTITYYPNSNEVIARWHHVESASDVVVTLESSEDLTRWDPVPHASIEVTGAQHEARFTPADRSRFVRLRWLLP